MAAIPKGTAHVYGISGTVSGLTVQSYTISETFANQDEVSGPDGKVIGVRLDDKRVTLTVEGLVPSGYSGEAGDNLTFNGNNLSFAGFITSVEDRGEAKGFTRVSITAVQYEGIS